MYSAIRPVGLLDLFIAWSIGGDFSVPTPGKSQERKPVHDFNE